MNELIVICPYCNQQAQLVDYKAIFKARRTKVSGMFYLCEPCDAYAGADEKSHKPYGRLANAELRSSRQEAHAYFDVIWKCGDMSRSDAYSWLAQELGIPKKDAHIGKFGLDICKKVIKLSKHKIK